MSAEAGPIIALEGKITDADVVCAAFYQHVSAVTLVLPSRSFERERRSLGLGRLRGADLWHVACALFVAGSRPGDLAFLSRDAAQRMVARRLGFPTP
jgi:hypothetical protein